MTPAPQAAATWTCDPSARAFPIPDASQGAGVHFQGLRISTPIGSKSRTLRVTTVMPWTRAVAAIKASRIGLAQAASVAMLPVFANPLGHFIRADLRHACAQDIHLARRSFAWSPAEPAIRARARLLDGWRGTAAAFAHYASHESPLHRRAAHLIMLRSSPRSAARALRPAAPTLAIASESCPASAGARG